MPTYRMTIDRTVRFQLDLEADSRLDALQKVMSLGLHYDGLDLKETHVVAIKELEKIHVLDSLN
jgi:hypothetical protein